MDDTHLLHRYVEERSDEAFTQLVHRHLNLVYFAALRRARDDEHAAEEIAQRVFTSLAQKASSLTRHTALTGWLYSATQLACVEYFRNEARRRLREHKAYAMQEHSNDSAHDAEWASVRPLIDEALGDLSGRDREALLLRFFENRTYGEIATSLGLNENSVRMRVERALEKLRRALDARGITSTTTALASGLLVPAACAAPAGLAQQIATTALAAAVGGAAGGTILASVHFMASSKLTTVAVTVAALLAAGSAFEQHRAVQNARAELATSTAASAAKIQELETRLQTTSIRLAEAQSQNQQLLAASKPTGDGQTAAAAARAVPVTITREQVQARLTNAKELAAAGKYAEALAEYLWCYDTGTRHVEGYFITRYSAVVDAIADIGKNYPPALEALRLRRDGAEQRLRDNSNDLETGKEFAHINRALGENQRTFDYFDSLSEDDPRRGSMVDTSISRLMGSQRYRELAKAMPYDGIPKTWEDVVTFARAPGLNPEQQARHMSFAVRFAATQIEMRAGAGDALNATDMIERLFIFDGSAKTVETVKNALKRAGRPDLFAP